MEKIAESNLSVFEAQNSDELSFEELESVAGGNWWDDTVNAVKEGARDFLQGAADGIGGRDDSETNLNYLSGHVLGGLAGSLSGSKKGK